jgi:23S rRNA (guanosine2251-2'-O)-methyltransferase
MRKVVGLHSVREAMKVRPQAIARILLKQGWEKSQDLNELAELAAKIGTKIKTVGVTELDQLSHGHQGVGAEVLETPEIDWASIEKSTHSILLGLDGIEDPQNLGGVLRSAWIFGASGVLLPSSRAISMTPVVAKVACGGAEHVPLEIHANLQTPLTRLKDKGFWTFALSEKADKTLWDLKIPEKVVWVVGAEGTGVRKSTLSACDELVAIPQSFKGASLNAAVSAAIALAETRRQWQSS